MLRYFLIFFLFMCTSISNAEVKEKIIQNLKDTKNLDFKFEQNVNGKIENGNCTIEYQKKIFCEYARSNNKILVSNGKSLVIKNQTSNQYYFYPLKRTPLDLILNKNYLINQIKKLEGRDVENKFLNFTIQNNDNKINIFFDNKTLNLVGWQTEDIYQNLVITYISKIKFNQKIDKDIFKLPKMN